MRQIKKALAGKEDLLRGVGKEVQTRFSGDVTITKLNSTHFQGALIVDTIKDLVSLDLTALEENSKVYVLGFHEINDGGGGLFIFNPNTPKTEHNGGTIIAPGKAFPDDWDTDNANWFSETSTDLGCFERVLEGDYVTPEMFGAKGDGFTDDINAINYAVSLNIPIKLIDGKVYFISTTITMNNYDFNRKGIFCDGIATIKSNNDISFIRIEGGSGELNKSLKLEGIKFVGNSNLGIGIELAGCCGITYNRCYFYNLKYGVLYHNDISGSFTESCVGTNCSFKENINAVRYKVTDGNDSFHGSGLVNCWINNNIDNSPIYIEDGCYVYNAPMTINCFGTNAGIIENHSTLPVIFTGDIRLEGHNADVSNANTVRLAGSIVGIDNYKLGSLYLIDVAKITGPDTNNIFYFSYKPRTFAVKTTIDGQLIDLGSDATFYVSSNDFAFYVSVVSNNGDPSFHFIILRGYTPIFDNNGDTLQLVVPSAGTVVQVKVLYNFINPFSTFNGQVLENYKEI